MESKTSTSTRESVSSTISEHNSCETCQSNKEYKKRLKNAVSEIKGENQVLSDRVRQLELELAEKMTSIDN